MTSLASLIRDNRSTFWMLLSALIFYSFLFMVNHSSQETPEGMELKKTEAVARAELKQKEEDFKLNIKRHPVLIRYITLFLGTLLFAGISLDIYFIARKLRGLPFWESTATAVPVNWGPAEVLRLFIILLFLEALIMSIEMMAAPFLDTKHWNQDVLLMANSLVRNLLVALCVLFWVKRRFKMTFAAIGLTTKGFFKNVERGLIAYVAVIPILFGLLLVMSWIAQVFSYEPEPQAVVQMYLKGASDKTLIFFTLFVALIGPAIEEILFRGFAYSAFRRRWGSRAALLASAALFAFLHMNLIALIPIFVLGIYLAYLYEKTGSLVPSMTLHMTHNFLMVVAALFIKGIAA